MKATIKRDGTLYVQAETEIEGYALDMWSKCHAQPVNVPSENLIDGSKMVFCSDPKQAGLDLSTIMSGINNEVEE